MFGSILPFNWVIYLIPLKNKWNSNDSNYIILSQIRFPLHDLQQLHLEYQIWVLGNQALNAPLAISSLRGTHHSDLLAYFHSRHNLIPTLDHMADADLGLERLTSVVGGVELLPRRKGPSVVHEHPGTVLDWLGFRNRFF